MIEHNRRVMTPRVFIYSVVSVLVCFSSPNAFAKEKQPEKLFDQIENEIMKEPTSQENAQARFDVVANVAKMLIPVSGQSKVDEVLPPQKFARIFDVLAKRDFKQAGSLIDAALMGLLQIRQRIRACRYQKGYFPKP